MQNILQTIGLNEHEWCKAHWTRVINAISVGMKEEEIETIYDDISYVGNNCKPLSKYLRRLDKVQTSELLKKVQALLISD